MSRKNNLQLRRVHHVSMLREEAAREALAKKRKQRRIAKKEKAAADRELAGALDKIVKVDETVAGKVPKIGAPLPVENGDEKMGLSRRGSGRIRKKKKKDVERAKKIRQRMLERSAMLM